MRVLHLDNVGVADVVSDQAHLLNADFPVRAVRILFDHAGWSPGSSASNSDGALS